MCLPTWHTFYPLSPKMERYCFNIAQLPPKVGEPEPPFYLRAWLPVYSAGLQPVILSWNNLTHKEQVWIVTQNRIHFSPLLLSTVQLYVRSDRCVTFFNWHLAPTEIDRAAPCIGGAPFRPIERTLIYSRLLYVDRRPICLILSYAAASARVLLLKLK